MHDKITTEVFQVGGPYLTSHDDAAAYLIFTGTNAALVDAGCGTEPSRLIDNIRSCGVMPEQVAHLLITHCHIDHIGGAAAIREMTGCQTVAHAADAIYCETGDDTVTAAKWYGKTVTAFTVDRKLAAPVESILMDGRDVSAVHVPGHSPGSVVYLFESDGSRVLFAQDVHGPLHPILQSDQDDYIRSLKRIIELEADILCEGHFGIYRGKDEVRRFVQSFL
ncbi:MAG: MBL fold metallo-hydrolase [Thermodesulfobacteriota bacterium]